MVTFVPEGWNVTGIDLQTKTGGSVTDSQLLVDAVAGAASGLHVCGEW